jgi:RND family efflux transporter MFP subunit
MQRVIMLTTLLLLTGSPAAMGQADKKPASTSPAAKGPKVIAGYLGIVSPIRRVDVSTPIEGILENIEVKEGQPVKARQALANIDYRLQQSITAAAILRAESTTELTQATLQLKDSEMELEKTQNLFKKGAAPEWEVRKATLARDLAKAGVQAATDRHMLNKQTLKIEQTRLSLSIIGAPFDAVVLKLHTERGTSLRVSDPIMTLVAMDQLKAEFHLPAAIYGKLTKGNRYAMEARTPVNKTIIGRLTVIDPVIDSASQTFRVVFEIDNADRALPAGFTVRLLGPAKSSVEIKKPKPGETKKTAAK